MFLNLNRLAILAVAALSLTVHAIDTDSKFPTRTVRWVVPFNPGGPADMVARTVTQQLEKKWGQSIVVDNKPGGNGIIAAADVLKSTPDGHTLLQTLDSMLTMNQFLYGKPPYDPLKDFSHITQLASLYPFLLARQEFGPKNVAELVAYARANPGKVTIGYPAQSSQLIGEQISEALGIKLTAVPYKSGIDMVKGLLGSEIDLGIEGGATAISYVKSDKLRAIAAVSPQRSSGLPAVPTIKESGFNSAGLIWHGLSGPANIPLGVQQKIQKDIHDVLSMPDVREKLLAAGLEPVGSAPAEYLALIKSGAATSEPIIKRLGMKVN